MDIVLVVLHVVGQLEGFPAKFTNKRSLFAMNRTHMAPHIRWSVQLFPAYGARVGARAGFARAGHGRIDLGGRVLKRELVLMHVQWYLLRRSTSWISIKNRRAGCFMGGSTGEGRVVSGTRWPNTAELRCKSRGGRAQTRGALGGSRRYLNSSNSCVIPLEATLRRGILIKDHPFESLLRRASIPLCLFGRGCGNTDLIDYFRETRLRR
mmetsp:Transcript_16400/g.42311  ORF Transcript_16400/g.42311 Transcript_16400/m.42311 type:complete len:209 (-) Transcript_16400:128-754(-)